MAVGYHKLNTSAARSKRRHAKEIDRPVIHERGLRFSHPIYGEVTTMEDFVSDRDVVECVSTQGKLILSGGFIREWVRISNAS